MRGNEKSARNPHAQSKSTYPSPKSQPLDTGVTTPSSGVNMVFQEITLAMGR